MFYEFMCAKLFERMNVVTLSVYGFTTIQVGDLIVSSYNKKLKRKRPLSSDEMHAGCKIGIDTHADTSCAGRHARIIEYIDGKSYNVAPFHSGYQPLKEIGLVNAIIAIDLEDGSGIILELNNFLNFTDSMDDCILVPMQCRLHGIIVDDVPKQLCPYGTSTQSIYVPEGKIRIPIRFNGPIPYISARYPTDSDMDNFKWITLTSMNEWQPYSSQMDDFNDLNKIAMSEDYMYMKALKTIFISAVKMTNAEWTDLSPARLSKIWRIPIKVANNILECTTHTARRIQDGKMSIRFRTNQFQKRYRRLGGEFSRFYTDTLFFGLKTRRGNTCSQIFVNRCGFIKIYNLPGKSFAHEALSSFIHEVGIPSSIHSDGAKELVEGEFLKKMRKYEIHGTVSEPYSPWQNHAERYVGIIKRRARQIMSDTNTPVRLLDYVMKYVVDILNFIPNKTIYSDGRSPSEIVLGNTPNISEFVEFEWFCFIWFWNPASFQRQQLGRWLGVSDHIGSGHVYYVLSQSGFVEARSTVSKLSDDDLNSAGIQQQIKEYKQNIKLKIGDYNEAIFADDEEEEIMRSKENLEFVDDTFTIHDDHTDDIVDNSTKLEKVQNLSAEISDEYIGAKVQFPKDGKLVQATVKERKKTDDGQYLIGVPNSNPIKDTRIYNVEFPDGDIEEYTTNLISESIFDTIDDDGYTFSILKGIVGHRKNDDAVDQKDGFIVAGKTRKRVVTTAGWDVLVEWEDSSYSWIPLKAIKSSNPVELAEYAVVNDLVKEPAFAWWVGDVLRKRNRIVSKLRTNKKVRKNIKFGVEVPIDIDQAMEFDKLNKNDLWKKALDKEISKVRVAFELIDNDATPLPGSKLINYHVIFDVKHDLTRKARLVAGGHLNKQVPSYVTYSSVVTKESIRLCFLLAALNDLEVTVGDIGNAYLNAKPREKCYVTITDSFLFGPSCVGRKAQIVRALYGMKSSGAAWRELFASVLHNILKFDNSMADHDVWLKPDVDNGDNKYYSYICIYVDDVMIVSKDPSIYMNMIKDQFSVKPESIQEPTMYLGMNCRKNEQGIWLLNSTNYTREFLKISERILSEIGMDVKGRGTHPFSNLNYRPELDTSFFCNENQIRVYQQLLGMFRWMIELGRMDILFETTLLASYLASPRVGHLAQAVNMVSYIKKHQKSNIIMDPAYLDVHWQGNETDNPEFKRDYMKSIYHDACEDVPENAPEPRGRPLQLNVYCDSDHATNKITRRSHTGILIFANMAPISWFSKRQNTVESSTFGSEYVALRIAIEKIISLRYKLRMMGVPIDGSTNVFVDNESVVRSSMNPEASLKKKHVSIAYHKARESFAANIVTIFHVPSAENLADLFTKVLPVHKRKELFRSGIFY